MRFLTVLGYFGRFLDNSSLVLLKTEYNQFIFYGTLVHLNIFRLGLSRAFFDAWFIQNIYLTELNSPISAVYFSFATIFHYFSFISFCSFSKLKICHECNFHGRELFVDINFHLLEIWLQTLGTI